TAREFGRNATPHLACVSCAAAIRRRRETVLPRTVRADYGSAVDSSGPRHLSGSEMAGPRRYSVVVAKDYLKFAAAHFIAYPGFREPLHGHNYQVSVRVEADLGPDGYVLDFGLVKRVAKALCEELDERVLVPEASDCLIVTRLADAVEVTTES